MVKVVFIQADGKGEVVCEGEVGQSLLNLAHQCGIDMEGACEASLACSTCHVIVDEDYFEKLPDASEEEEDMLDLTYALCRTSRLACQITLTKNIDGLRVKLPEKTLNMLY